MTSPERDPSKKPREGMIWSDKHEMWIYPDTRTPEQKEKDEEIVRQVERERSERREFWTFVLSRFAKGWPAYVACGHGWRGLILKLTEDLDKVWEGFDPRWKASECWHICQIKEKFGGLRYYADPSLTTTDKDSEAVKDDFQKRCLRFRDLIHEAEHKSHQVCESCSEKGEGRSVGGWLSTLCDDHYKQRLADHEKREAEFKKNAEIRKKQKGESHEGA